MRLKNQLSICFSECELWWDAIGIPELGITNEQSAILIRHFKTQLVSQIPRWIWCIGSSDNFSTDISEQWHSCNVQEVYRCTIKVSYTGQMMQFNDHCTCLDDIEETPEYLALEDWYNVDTAKVFNIPTTTDKPQNTCGGCLLHLSHSQQEPSFTPASQKVHHLRETHLLGVCRSIQLTSLRDAVVDFGIPNFVQLFYVEFEQDWGYKVSRQVLGYDQNVLTDSTFIKYQNGLLCYCQPLH